MTTQEASRTLPWDAVRVYQAGGQTADPLIGSSFRQARTRSGLNWEPHKTEVFFNLLGPDGPMPAELDRWRAVVRSDTQEALGIVGKDYQPFGNVDFLHLMDELVDVGGAQHAAMGVLKSGRRVYAVVKLNEDQADFRFNGDRYSPFVYGINGHDGGSSLHLGVTIIRWACTNGMIGVVPGATHFVNVRHSGKMAQRIAEATKVLAKAASFVHQFGNYRENLLGIRLSEGQLLDLREQLLPMPEPNGKNARQLQSITNRRIQLGDFMFASDNIEDFRYTGWGFVNAVAEWDQHGTHKRRTRSEMDRLVDGDQARVVARARELVLN